MNLASDRTPNLGLLGEQFVAGWLQSQDWVILHHRWRCRWGEIDLIAQQQERGTGEAGEAGGAGGDISNLTFAPLSPGPPLPWTPSPWHLSR